MPIAPRMNRPVGDYSFQDAMSSGLLGLRDMMKARLQGLLTNPAMPYLEAAGNAGLVASGDPTARQGALDTMAMQSGLFGDVLGPVADAHRLWNFPEERTKTNVGLSIAGLAPAVPSISPYLSAITTWHGSPHKWNVPDVSKTGTGQGVHTFGRGFYSAESPEVGKQYQKMLSSEVGRPGHEIFVDGKKISTSSDAERMEYDLLGRLGRRDYENFVNQAESSGRDQSLQRSILNATKGKNVSVKKSTGYLYKLDIPDEDVAKYLDYDKKFNEQPESVKSAIRKLWEDYNLFGSPDNLNGEGILGSLTANMHRAGSTNEAALEAASMDLNHYGIPGIRYLDGNSREAGKGTSNYVTFDPSRIKVLERNGEGLLGDLPMDQASRMKRAREYDFSGFHGTGDDINKFNGIAWMSETPELANEYATARYNMGNPNINIMPLVAKSGNVLDADKLPNTVTVNSFANEVLQQAIDRGINVDDANINAKAKDLLRRINAGAKKEESGPHYSRHDIWYKPDWMFGKEGAKALDEFFDLMGVDSISMTEHGQKTLGVRNPKNIRSRFAAFDPAKKDSSDLLAQWAAMGLLGGGLGAGLLYNEQPSM